MPETENPGWPGAEPGRRGVRRPRGMGMGMAMQHMGAPSCMELATPCIGKGKDAHRRDGDGAWGGGCGGLPGTLLGRSTTAAPCPFLPGTARQRGAVGAVGIPCGGQGGHKPLRPPRPTQPLAAWLHPLASWNGTHGATRPISSGCRG